MSFLDDESVNIGWIVCTILQMCHQLSIFFTWSSQHKCLGYPCLCYCYHFRVGTQDLWLEGWKCDDWSYLCLNISWGCTSGVATAASWCFISGVATMASWGRVRESVAYWWGQQYSIMMLMCSKPWRCLCSYNKQNQGHKDGHGLLDENAGVPWFLLLSKIWRRKMRMTQYTVATEEKVNSVRIRWSCWYCYCWLSLR